MIYITDSLLLGIFNHFQFSIITPHDPVCELMRVSNDFRKVEEMPQCGTIESKRVSVWNGLGNTVRQSSQEVVQIFSHLTGTESLRFPTSKPSFIIIFSNSIWGTEPCNWFDYCFFDPYLSWTNFHMLISHFTLFALIWILGIVCVPDFLFIFVTLTFWGFIRPQRQFTRKGYFKSHHRRPEEQTSLTESPSRVG